MSETTIQFCRRCAVFLALAGCFTVSAAPPACAATPWNLPGLRTRAPQPTVQPGVFPSIAAEALDRTDLNLPGQLEGRQNLLLLSWARNQGAQLETWTAVAQALQHTHFDFRVYRMPVTPPENALFRWWDNASFRAEETDPELLRWTVPLYTDKAQLHRAFGTNGEEGEIVVLLVDRAGRILWKAQGSSTDATRASLLAAAGQK